MPEVVPAALEAVIAVINGWSRRVRVEAGEADTAHPDPPELPGVEQLGPPEERDERLAAMAGRLYPIFAGDTTAERRGALNAAIRRLEPVPVVATDGPRWWVDNGSDAPEAALVLALREHARDDRHLDRLGVCAAHRCVDAFLDTSQARSRRYCSLTCQNRAKVAAYRRRQR